MEGGSGSIIALGDQVQAACVASALPIVGFLIITSDGQAEYRSPYPIDVIREKLAEAVSVL